MEEEDSGKNLENKVHRDRNLEIYFEIFEINNNVTKKTMLLRKILIGIIIILISFAVYSSVNISGVSDQDYNSINDTIEFILINEDISNVKLYTGYNDGGLAEFKGIPSYLDTRAEVFVKKNNKKDDVLKEYFQLQTGTIYYKDVLNKYNFTHLIVTEDDILNTYLKHDDDYGILYSNNKYTLFEKK